MMPSSILSVVVLPAPFGPSTPKIAPAGTERSTPSTAVNPSKRLTSPRASIASGAAPTLPDPGASPSFACIEPRLPARPPMEQPQFDRSAHFVPRGSPEHVAGRPVARGRGARFRRLRDRSRIDGSGEGGPADALAG